MTGIFQLTDLVLKELDEEVIIDRVDCGDEDFERVNHSVENF